MATAEDREVLESWVKGAKTEQRLALRGRIILAAAAGRSGRAIARAEGIRPATVSKWCGRFSRRGIAGLQDAARCGAKLELTRFRRGCLGKTEKDGTIHIVATPLSITSHRATMKGGTPQHRSTNINPPRRRRWRREK